MKKNVKKIKLNKETLQDLTLPLSAVMGQVDRPVTVPPDCKEP